MKILITNNALDKRAGTELYVRDLALELYRQGHQPVVYSQLHGEVAEELKAATVPVVESLARIQTAPDIIHGQHNLETATAVLHFPNTPAVFFCHGWFPWEEAPPMLPNIVRYAAVSEACRDRLVYEFNAPVEHCRVIPNFVDLIRFARHPPQQDQSQRALLFCNRGEGLLPMRPLKEACARTGIDPSTLGGGFGNATDHPEDVLYQHDLVFAVGRSALEALAVGSAVILFSEHGSGPLVTSANFDRLRRLNFALRALRKPVSAENIVREIDRYERSDAATVTDRVRAEAGVDRAAELIVDLYREAIVEFKSLKLTSDQRSRAAAAYLAWLGPKVKNGLRLGTELCAARHELNSLRNRLTEQAKLENAQKTAERKRIEEIREDSRRAIAERDRLMDYIHAIHESRMWRFQAQIRRIPAIGHALDFITRPWKRNSVKRQSYREDLTAPQTSIGQTDHSRLRTARPHRRDYTSHYETLNPLLENSLEPIKGRPHKLNEPCQSIRESLYAVVTIITKAMYRVGSTGIELHHQEVIWVNEGESVM